MKDVRLEDLVPSISNFLVILNIKFLRKLMINASKSDKPWRDRKFINDIGYTFNENAKCSPAINRVFRKGTALHVSTLSKMVKLSDFKWDVVENNIISMRAGRKRGEIHIKFPIRVDKKLGSIVGHILGDGSITRSYLQVFYTNKNKELANEFYFYIKKIFGVKARIWMQKADYYNGSKWIKRVESIENIPNNMQIGLFYPSSIGIILHAILGKLACGRKKQITQQMFNSSNEFKQGLIAAFFDDEGSIRSENHTMRFHQDNKLILECLKLMLDGMGIKSNKIHFYYKMNKKRHYFNITGYRNYYLFYNLIGCTSSKKRNEFELLINKVKNSHHFKRKFAL